MEQAERFHRCKNHLCRLFLNLITFFLTRHILLDGFTHETAHRLAPLVGECAHARCQRIAETDGTWGRIHEYSPTMSKFSDKAKGDCGQGAF